METTNEAQTSAPAIAEPEYEWGVKFRSVRTGEVEIQWGYSEDPQLNGTIDEDGEIEIRKYYHPLVAVGKRLINPEVWKNISED